MARLLIPLDGSPLAERVIPHALAMARAFEVEVLLLRVIERNRDVPVHAYDEFDWSLSEQESRAYLKRFTAAFTDLGIGVECHVVGGSPAEAIFEFANDQRIDLIVMSAYGHGGVTRFPFGSTVQKVVSRARQSVLLVRPSEDGSDTGARSYKRILVPIDGSQRATWALCLAASIARTNDAALSVLRVVQVPEIADPAYRSPEAQKLIERVGDIAREEALVQLEQLRVRLLSGLDVEIDTVAAAEVAPVINRLATGEQVDLLVLSAHGSGNQWQYGSVCEAVLAHCTKPILIFQDTIGRKPNFQPRIRYQREDEPLAITA